MTVSQLLVHLALLLIAPPFICGVINKTKAVVAGRTGAPLLQTYYDLWKLLGKGAVYSTTTGWMFRAGPIVNLATVLIAAALMPLASARSPFGFVGDIIVFAYVMALGRFFTITAALDTGSSFEGMGASREAAISALAEPALFLSLAIVCFPTRSISFGQALRIAPQDNWGAVQPSLLAAAIALFIVLLAENSRIPVDDPNTHLELTMVHEVMVLDHGGPDFAFVVYASALKLFLMNSLIVHVLLPFAQDLSLQGLGLILLGQVLLSVIVGLVESATARLRLIRVPQFLLAASVIAALGLASLHLRGAP
jgi:formate hydrogenlyase subunit 4